MRQLDTLTQCQMKHWLTLKDRYRANLHSSHRQLGQKDLELAKSVADGLLNLIDARNKKCKVLK